MRDSFVRDMRLAHGLTVEEFAKRVGVAKGTILAAQHRENITPELKAKILRAFPIDDRFFYYIEMKKRLEGYEYYNK